MTQRLDPTRPDLRSYVPRILAGRVAERGAGAPPWSERLRGVVLIADLSGFTALAESLAPLGAKGAEELSRILDRRFGSMVELIARHGGDVLRFAGDAPIVLWRLPPDLPDPEADARLGGLVRAASACGLALAEAFHGRELEGAGRLRVRVGVAAGELFAAAVGGVEGRWELVVGGAPLREMAAAESDAGPGEVVLSPGAAALVAGSVPLAPTSGGASRVLPFAVSEADLEAAAEAPAAPFERASPFVPRAVLGRLRAGHASWVAELRRVSVLFALLRGLDDRDRDAPARLHDAFREMQDAVYRFEGGINQFLVDDKGTTLVAAWGMPGCTHEDDASRAVRASLEIPRRLARLGVGCSVGIASGRVFCGHRGGETRREYALIGAVVNLAARLAAASSGAAACDAATRDAARGAIEFEALSPLQVKGRDEAVAAFRPVRVTAARAPARRPGARAIVGREAERAALREALATLQGGRGATVVVEGEAGIGKSVLLGELAEQAAASDVRLSAGAGDAVASDEAYSVWRALLPALVGLPSDATAAIRRERVAARLGDDARLASWMPLIGGLLDLAVDDNDVTRQMSREARADATRELVVALLERALGGVPLVLVLDDAHWLDSASCALALAIRRRLPRTLLVVGTRPAATGRPSEIEELAREEGARTLELGRLEGADVEALVASELGATDVPVAVLELFRAKAGGHPLFVSELARSLVEDGAVVVENGACRVAADRDVLASHRFPDTVEGVVLSRLDRLGAREQLTLKVASVIGSVFAYSVLHDVHPVEADRPTLRDQLDVLTGADITAVEVPEPRLAHAFRHAVIHEVAYRLMVPAQRRSLHRQVALWFEREQADDPPLALLAHHWIEAEDDERAFDALERAGGRAAKGGADREAARLFRRALDLARERGPRSVEPLRRVRWQRELAHARYVLGEMDAADEAIRDAMRGLGQTLPQGPAGWGARLAREAARQAWHLAWPRWLPVPRTSGGRARKLEAARLASLVADMSFYRDDALPFVTASLHSVNLAEAAGSWSSAPGGYATLAYLAAIMRLERLARRWWRRCEESGEARHVAGALFGQGLHALGHCRFDEGERIADRAIDLSRRTGDRFSLESALTVKLYLQHYAGRFRESLATAQEILDSARSRASRQREVWGHLALASDLLDLGDTRRALAELAEVERREKDADRLSVATYHGLLTTASLRSGDAARAEAEAERALELLRGSSPLSFANFAVFVPIVEAYVALAARSLGSDDYAAARHLASARAAWQRLRRFARTFPFARPRTLVLEGRIAELAGAPRRARRAWRAGLSLAGRCGMPYERAKAHEALGRTRLEGPGPSKAHLEQALALYGEMGCALDAARVEALLAGGAGPREPAAEGSA